MTFGAGFSARLIELADKGCWAPEWGLGVWTYESGLDSAIRNSIGAAGLNQMMPATLHDMGYDEAVRGGFQHQSPAVQLEYIARGWEWWRKTLRLERWQARAHLYQATFWPRSAAGPFDPDEVILDKVKQAKAYAANRNLDVTGPQGKPDGIITVAELELAIQRGIRDHQARYDAEVGALIEARATRGEVHVPVEQATWAAVQAALVAHGVYTGPLDGLPGAMTLTGVARFLGCPSASWNAIQGKLREQGAYVGDVDGKPGPLTLAAFAQVLRQAA